MLTTLLTLLGGSLGGLLRFVPEIFKLFSEGRQQDHEYRMTRLQPDFDKARAGQAIDLVHAQGDKGDRAPAGVAWIDGLNQSVRPVVTYWWMSIFTVYKGCAIGSALNNWTTLNDFAGKLWTDQDAGTLAMILGFWFVDRAIRKNSGK